MCRPVMTLLHDAGEQAQRQANSKEPRPASSTCGSFSDVEYSSDDFDDSCLDEPLHSSSWQLRCSETAAFRAAGSRFASARPLPTLQQAEPELPPSKTDDAVMAILSAALQHQQLNTENSSSAAAATAAAAAAIGADSLFGLLSLPLPAFDTSANLPVHRCLFDDGAAGGRAACGAACNSSGIAANAGHPPSSLPSSLSSGDDSDSEDGRVQQWLASLETQGEKKRARRGSAHDSPAADPGSTSSPAWTVGDLSPPGFSVLRLLGQPSGLLQP